MFATSHLNPEYSAGQTHPGPGIAQVPLLSQKNPPLHRVTALEHPDPEKSRGHAQVSWSSGGLHVPPFMHPCPARSPVHRSQVTLSGISS
eukprot:CAMPEP_0119219024 /NCGR_PEP_ID=MMETSP1327-20130426/22349_1 /TAXON_ID=38833 /ORGANISM="Micromonas pusilla, Strain RCC2306" /LENGTH=89 /DNA_ID=CAMNT_0007217071 /DNA_START=268 /DNA_END=534 /DNA_ORIENTATION=+